MLTLTPCDLFPHPARPHPVAPGRLHDAGVAPARIAMRIRPMSGMHEVSQLWEAAMHDQLL